MAKNCDDAYVPETVGGKEPQNSWHRHIVCVLWSGGALGVLLQFIHAAVTSQTSVFYNEVKWIWSRLKNAVITLVLKDLNLKLQTHIQTSIFIKLNCGMGGSQCS